MDSFEAKRPYQQLGIILREELSKGNYAIGDRLPPEREIAERLSVSRMVVREAIIMLELENLVEVKKGSGVYVINTPDQLSEPQTISEAGPFEMLQARQLLESNIAEFAAVQVTPNDIAKMKLSLKLVRMENRQGKHDDLGDKNFHICIAEATQNSVLVDILKQSWDRRENSQMWKKLHSRISEKNYRDAWIEDHERILAAMQKKDPVAAKNAMWLHLENVKEVLLDLSDVDDPDFDGYLFNSNPVISINETI